MAIELIIDVKTGKRTEKQYVHAPPAPFLSKLKNDEDMLKLIEYAKSQGWI